MSNISDCLSLEVLSIQNAIMSIDLQPLTNPNLNTLILKYVNGIKQDFSQFNELSALENIEIYTEFPLDMSNSQSLSNLINLKVISWSNVKLSHLGKIESLEISELNDQNCDSISNSQTLTSLIVHQFNCSTSVGLSTISNLEKLSIYNVRSLDLSILKTIDKLTDLSLEFSSQPLDSIGQLTNLKKLNLRNWSFTDLSPISNLTELESLSINYSNLYDISFLNRLTNLNHLDLSNNYIIDLLFLSQLTNLNHLDLSNNYIFDLSPLSQLTNLNHLNLNSNYILYLKTLETLFENPNFTLNAQNQILFKIATLNKYYSISKPYLLPGNIVADEEIHLSSLNASKIDSDLVVWENFNIEKDSVTYTVTNPKINYALELIIHSYEDISATLPSTGLMNFSPYAILALGTSFLIMVLVIDRKKALKK